MYKSKKNILKNKKKIVFFSGNRAELDFQKPVFKILNNFKKLKLYFVLSGTHTIKNFYSNNIYKEKYFELNSKKISININTKSLQGTSNYFAKLVEKFNFFLKNKKIDYAFLCSDRFESFAVATSCFLNGIKIIHYEGGDVTEGGTYDDKIRNSISQIANYHLVSNKYSAINLHKMGINKNKIYDVGLLSLNSSFKIKRKNFNKLFNSLKLDKEKKILVVTYHANPSEGHQNFKYAKNLFETVNYLTRHKNFQAIVTYPNQDPGYDVVLEALKNTKFSSNVKIIKNLGALNYHLMLNYCGNENKGICIGNSSSGIKETETFNCPTVNIGKRQKGRIASKNVINCGNGKKQILESVIKANNNKFRKNIKKSKKIYFKINSNKILKEALHKIIY